MTRRHVGFTALDGHRHSPMPYSNPPSNLRSLQDRIVQAAQREGIVFGRLQRHVAVLVVTSTSRPPSSISRAPRCCW